MNHFTRRELLGAAAAAGAAGLLPSVAFSQERRFASEKIKHGDPHAARGGQGESDGRRGVERVRVVLLEFERIGWQAIDRPDKAVPEFEQALALSQDLAVQNLSREHLLELYESLYNPDLPQGASLKGGEQQTAP